MARGTHLPGRDVRRARALTMEGDPTRGATLVAPTAPHATAPPTTPRAPSGPARFWDRRSLRVASSLAFALSVVFHWMVTPWELLPPSEGIEFLDPAGELSIPIDLIGEEPPPEPPASPPEPLPVTPVPAEADDEDAPGRRDAGASRTVDAGAPPAEAQDAGAPTDAGADDADEDAGDDDAETAVDAVALDPDAGAHDAVAEHETSDAGLVATADAGAPGSGPRDPEAMFGLTKVVNAGVQNVVLGVNVALIREHPVGARMGPILQAIPQWREFLRGAPAPVDPIRDTDWILIYGPSLIHTDKDAVLVRYNVSDAAIDTTIGAIARTYDKGGPYDAGVPGVPASLGWADNAQRVFLRPQPKLLVIVPPSHAREAALTFKRQVPRGPSPAEAMRLIVHRPSNQISIPGLKFSSSLAELRLWIVPREDGGADVHAEGDCTDATAAAEIADHLTELLRRQNSFAVRLATRGLLNRAAVVAEGTKIKLHLVATPEQLEAVLQLTAAAVGAQVTPTPNRAPAAGTAPQP